MVYTITLAPAIDYIQRVKTLKKGSFNRGYSDSMEPGGKGINVSIILKRLGVESIALGFIGGFVGEYIIDSLNGEHIENNFVMVPGSSRINFKILCDEDKSETQVNGVGPILTSDKIEEFKYTLEDIKEGDTVVMDGLVPPGFEESTYKEILAYLSEKNIDLIIDTSGQALLDCLKYHPFLIKPNMRELSAIIGKPMDNEKQILEGIEILKEKGANNVIVSRGINGVIMVDSNGKVYKKKTLSEKAISTYGAGDALLAGFICGWKLYNDFDKALDIAIACGTSKALNGHHPTKDEVIHYLKLLHAKV